ncbi:MAG: LSM domain-containing protein [Promethearchaeota archaeon]
MELPIRILEKHKGKMVNVRIKSGSDFRGRLRLTDTMMNMTLEDAQELSTGDKPGRRLGKVLIRGNNVLLIKLEI